MELSCASFCFEVTLSDDASDAHIDAKVMQRVVKWYQDELKHNTEVFGVVVRAQRTHVCIGVVEDARNSVGHNWFTMMSFVNLDEDGNMPIRIQGKDYFVDPDFCGALFTFRKKDIGSADAREIIKHCVPTNAKGSRRILQNLRRNQ